MNSSLLPSAGRAGGSSGPGPARRPEETSRRAAMLPPRCLRGLESSHNMCGPSQRDSRWEVLARSHLRPPSAGVRPHRGGFPAGGGSAGCVGEHGQTAAINKCGGSQAVCRSLLRCRGTSAERLLATSVSIQTVQAADATRWRLFGFPGV